MKLRVWLCVCWIGAAFLAVPIAGSFAADIGHRAPTDPLYLLLGSSKEGIGDLMFLKADAYFHGGIEDTFPEETAEQLGREGVIEDHHDHDHDAHAKNRLSHWDWVGSMGERLKNVEHIHLAAKNRKELLPFFALGTALDPHNIDGLLTAAYWLVRDYEKYDDALQILEKGRRANPRSWEIDEGIGQLYYRQKQFRRSANAFIGAVHKMKRSTVDPPRRAEIYYLLADSLDHSQRPAKAVKAYRRALSMLQPSMALYTKIQKRLKA